VWVQTLSGASRCFIEQETLHSLLSMASTVCCTYFEIVPENDEYFLFGLKGGQVQFAINMLHVLCNKCIELN
jgi:hypothetical protein